MAALYIMTAIDEIKAKISIEEVIGDYISLKHAGDNYKTTCPFHEEKTPSFTVSPSKQIWHCFGCHEGGDVFGFVQKYEGVEFKDALRLLAQKTGVTLGDFQLQDSGRKDVLYAIHAVAQEYYQGQLQLDTDVAKKTRIYLEERGIDAIISSSWGLGLASGKGDALKDHLVNKKFTIDDIISSGLVVKKDKDMYDRFRKRLLFPILNSQGRVVAFTARTLNGIAYDDETVGGKYINSPQTLVYNKSKILYGLHHARTAIRKADYAIIVEGNTDVILSHAAGIKNVVASSGTALTDDQLELLQRLTKNLMLAFDPDLAGSQAVFRGITLAWKRELSVKVIRLPDKLDPADAIRKNRVIWKTAIKESIGAMDHYFQQVFSRVDLMRADHKKIAADKILEMLRLVANPVERSHYIALLATKLGMKEDFLWIRLDIPQNADPISEKDVTVKSQKISTVSEQLISFLSFFKKNLPLIIDEIEPEMLSQEVQDLYKKIIIYYTTQQSKDFRQLLDQLNADEMKLWSHLSFRGEQFYEDFSTKEESQELTQLIARIKKEYFTRRLIELTESIRAAEATENVDVVAQLLKEYNVISEKKKKYLS